MVELRQEQGGNQLCGADERQQTAHSRESFADHFSQAWQFFYSQTETEENHIAWAHIFELSKVARKSIRERMVGQLANVDEKIAERLAAGLGPQTIESVPATVKVRTSLLDVAGAMKDEGVLMGNGVDAFVSTAKDGRVWSREPRVRTVY